MELNSNQQQKYQTQFGENGEPTDIEVVISEAPGINSQFWLFKRSFLQFLLLNNFRSNRVSA